MAFPAVLVKGCLNGGRRRAEHPRVPETPAELAEEARAAAIEWAGALHFHPRADDGAETLAPDAVAAAVRAVRAACPALPLGVSTGLWITGGDEAARLRAVERWEELPDFASVNVSEPGWE